MVELELTEMATPIGVLRVAGSRAGLVAMGFEDHWERVAGLLERRLGQATLHSAKDAAGCCSRIRGYFEGDLEAIASMTVHAVGSSFQRQVWSALREIPAGRTLTYRELAERAGVDHAVRAAGTACGANAIGIVIPCHRVLRAGGEVGRYGDGPERKRWLLQHEGAFEQTHAGACAEANGNPRGGGDE